MQTDQIDDHAVMEGGSTLVIRRWLPGPAERIWRYLTDSKLRSKWLAAGEMAPVAGATLELVWRNDELSHGGDRRPEGFAEEQRMDSRVIAIDPPRLLTIGWGKGDVTFELQERGDRVLLTLTHRGLDDPRDRTMTASGWHMHLDILVAEASGQPPASFWSGWVKLRDDYARRLSA
ncbi:SRPBCC family protein [uncultured Paracoccus sp.]|uniref:SRPBCC family protein n=1 Tax=uncultured Paracoccus sp. TaxID=189685 RepID=UPI002638B901|nr:SRPBCC family protein [uncultured Paracoccus sp.]